MTNAFILCLLVWKIQKSHAANRDGSFKCNISLCAYKMEIDETYTILFNKEDIFLYAEIDKKESMSEVVILPFLTI